MSHDLRTPLGAIGGFADLTADGVYGPVNDAQRNAMDRIRRAGDHLLALINDILAFAKIEAGRIHLDIARVDVGDVVAAAIGLTEMQAERRGLTLAAQPPSEGIEVTADRERVIQILVNLLTNALKFTNAGSVTVDWRSDEQTAHVDVRDTGRGIPTDKLASIFEPFVQAGRSEEEQQQGVGLGLATSRELARAMGGDLTVASTVGQGSTFTLTLPRALDRTTS
jgi:signal transduction histidine kinase